MKTVVTYGTFDLFHIGHVRLLERAKELGNRLVVGVSTDAFNEVKGKRTVIPYEQRAAIVRSNRYVDEVFPEEDWSQKEHDIRRFAADVFVMGDDWKGKFDHFGTECKVVYLPRTHGISSSELKTALGTLQNDKISEIKSALSVLQVIVDQLGE